MRFSTRHRTVTLLTLATVLGVAAPARAAPAGQAQEAAAGPQQAAMRDNPVVLTDAAVDAAARPAVAQGGGRDWYFGIRGGAYFDVDEPFVGAELLFPITGDIWFNPNVEWVFVDNADLASVNADIHFDLPTGPSYSFWIGGGLGLRYLDPDGPLDGDWDAGVNALAGLGFGHGRVIPYVQGKLFINDSDAEFILAGGFRF